MDNKERGLGIDWPNGKPKGPQNTGINNGINHEKFNWYCAGIGFSFGAMFFSACHFIWG